MQTKVVAYITRGRQLLVFEHAGLPEAGLQVPAGTVEPGEALEAALWREVGEESGLTREQLVFKGWLRVVDHPAFAVVRHYGWLEADPSVPARWLHRVGGGGDDNGLLFAYRWEAFPPPRLEGRQDECLTDVAAW